MRAALEQCPKATAAAPRTVAWVEPDVRVTGPPREREADAGSLPIIFITAHVDEEVAARAMTDGAVDFLIKPFSEEALLSALKKAFAR